MERKYYEAYDDRYKQVHNVHLRWFDQNHSPILEEVIKRYNIGKQHRILEIGCGEGRDAAFLLKNGHKLLATDVSCEAIRFCKDAFPDKADQFAVLNCLEQKLNSQFDFIYAIAVIHMLVPDEDRTAFYRFVAEHLSANGICLICSMGDGEREHSSDVTQAFTLQNRLHEQSGTYLQIASTSCRVVSMQNFENEIKRNDLSILEIGKTAIEPDFPQMLYAVVAKQVLRS